MRIAHPEAAFREAAEEACRSIGTAVEKYGCPGALRVRPTGPGPRGAAAVGLGPAPSCPVPRFAAVGREVLPAGSGQGLPWMVERAQPLARALPWGPPRGLDALRLNHTESEQRVILSRRLSRILTAPVDL